MKKKNGITSQNAFADARSLVLAAAAAAAVVVVVAATTRTRTTRFCAAASAFSSFLDARFKRCDDKRNGGGRELVPDALRFKTRWRNLRAPLRRGFPFEKVRTSGSLGRRVRTTDGYERR